MLLYIIRHGEPNYATDSLTPNGKKQADALAERLCVHGFDEIYCSPLGRAIQTAEPTCERLGIPYKIEQWMSEDAAWDDFSAIGGDGNRNWAFGCQNTKLTDGDYKNWHENPVFAGCKAAQSGYKRIADCSDEFLARLGYERGERHYKIKTASEKRIAAFCHHGLGTAWLSHLLSIPPNVFWASFNIAHSSVTIVELANNADGITAPQCVCLSDISHIYKAELPLSSVLGVYGGGV
ncbi:MAG: histidine phosphatase family protein [Oscillospiraceae bacterium]|nr:histidine phosphatase family protein [Oscillospiraceae bacterium]